MKLPNDLITSRIKIILNDNLSSLKKDNLLSKKQNRTKYTLAKINTLQKI